MVGGTMKITSNITKDEIANYECLAVDTEWTKNYKVKNGNKPFNFSIIFFNHIDIEELKKYNLDFKFVSGYIETEEDIPALITLINNYLDPNIHKLIIGHQVISDLYTFYHYSEHFKDVLTNNIKVWISLFKDRHNNHRIFDTRFDVKNYLTGKSRRLVDVCYEMRILNQEDLYHQLELKKSMTAMQNAYMESHSKDIYEKLSVLNLRHSLSTMLVYEIYRSNQKLKNRMNINKILYNNLHDYFDYVNTREFKELMRLRKVSKKD